MAIIKTLKDKLGNIVYPQTLVTGVYDSSGKTLDTLMDKKMGVVSSATAGNLPTLTADGQLVDSGKKIDEVGGGTEDFIVALSTEDGVSFTCDKTSAEINQAHAEGKNIVVFLNDVLRPYIVEEHDGYYGFQYFGGVGLRYDGVQMLECYIDASSDVLSVKTSTTSVLSTAADKLDADKKAQFRSNIGAGTSNFSGSYNDLTDKPTLIPTSRTINGKALSSNITLTAADVGALPATTTVPTIHSGTTDPSATLGSDGDLYIKYAE